MQNDNDYDFPLPGWFKIVLVAIAVLWMAFFLTSCQTQKKVTRYLNENNSFAAEYCGLAFPVRDSIIYKPGRVISKSDTTYLPGDSIPCPELPNYDKSKNGKPVYVHCPPNKRITDTIFKVDTITVIRENTAKISYLTQANTTLSNSLKTYKNKAEHRGKLMWWTWGILAVLIAGYFFIKSRTAIFTNIISRLKK